MSDKIKVDMNFVNCILQVGQYNCYLLDELLLVQALFIDIWIFSLLTLWPIGLDSI